MEFVTSNMSNFPSNVLSDSLPAPIWNIMEDLIETKPEGINEFDTFFHDAIHQSDSENDSLHNAAASHTGFRSSVSEDETSMSCPVAQIGSQICFTSDMLPQDASLESCYTITPNRYEWAEFEQLNPRDTLASLGNQAAVQNSDLMFQRRCSLPSSVSDSLPSFPDFTGGRKRVFSWGDLDDASAVLHDLDLSQQSARRSSVNIPLHNTKNTFINVLNPTKITVPDEKSNYRGDSVLSIDSNPHFDHNGTSKKLSSSKEDGREQNESDPQQNVVEKRLNRRRERNRLAARRSREKRTQFLRDLEGLNQALRNENSALKAKLCNVLQELEALRATTSSLH